MLNFLQVAAMAGRWNGWMPLERSSPCGRTCWIVRTSGLRAAWFCVPVWMAFEPICHRPS